MNRKVILVAEDDVNDIVLLKRSFLAAGIETDLQFVSDGEKAIDYLNGTDDFADRQAFPLPRLVLLDLKMPKVDGFGVLKWMRQHQRFNCTVAIVLSSSNEPNDVRRAYELRANSFIQKPPDGPAKDFAHLIFSYWMDSNICIEDVCRI